MGTSTSQAESRATTAISVGKDIVSLARDGALSILALLLIVFPHQFNTVLVNAGFEEGSLVGFKWRAKLIENNTALEKAQATISDLQRKNEELAKVLAQTNAQLHDTALTAQIAKFQDDNRRLKDATQQVQTTVAQAIESNIPFIEKARGAMGPRPKSDYSVGLQTLGISDAERTSLNEKLQSGGYNLDPLTASYPSEKRPGWFAERSTVLYYSASSLAAAQELARFMQTLTGQTFTVQRGAGLGVDPSRRDVTLFVHYIKS
jgi:hypothetical protein